MIVCIAGKNDIAVNCTDWILAEGFITKENLRVCFNKTDRGEDGFQKSFKKYAQQNNLLESKLEDLYELEDLIFISLEFDRLIKPTLFKSKALFNIHFSLLPKYRGMYTSAWPILNGENSSGVTLHVIDEGIDTGDIIAQKEFSIEDSNTSRDLYFKYLSYGEKLFQSNFESLLLNSFVTRPQKGEGSYYSKGSIDYENHKINLQKTAIEIKNKIRAFHFKEYQLPQVNGHFIDAAEILTTPSDKAAGSILQMQEHFIDMATLDYDLRLYLIEN